MDHDSRVGEWELEFAAAASLSIHIHIAHSLFISAPPRGQLVRLCHTITGGDEPKTWPNLKCASEKGPSSVVSMASDENEV